MWLFSQHNQTEQRLENPNLAGNKKAAMPGLVELEMPLFDAAVLTSCCQCLIVNPLYTRHLAHWMSTW